MKNYWLNKRDETTNPNPIVNWGTIKFDFFKTLERDTSWKEQLRLMVSEIALQLESGPENVTFKELYAKYPKVRCGARRLLMAAKKELNERQ